MPAILLTDRHGIRIFNGCGPTPWSVGWLRTDLP